MNIVIFEDEVSASKRLRNMLRKIDPDIVVSAVIDTIEDAVIWLKTHKEPDLVFADIQLSDGTCFDIFRQVATRSAVIFTTAYNEYAVEAFKVNSIDYLLKPVNSEDLKRSIEKFQQLKITYGSSREERITELLNTLDLKERDYKSRFLVKTGNIMKPVLTDDVAYFYIENQLVFIVDKSARKFLVEYSLDDLEKSLDPSRFFRINRQMIISLTSVSTIHSYFNGRLKLDLTPDFSPEVLVSRLKVADFKSWLDR